MNLTLAILFTMPSKREIPDSDAWESDSSSSFPLPQKKARSLDREIPDSDDWESLQDRPWVILGTPIPDEDFTPTQPPLPGLPTLPTIEPTMLLQSSPALLSSLFFMPLPLPSSPFFMLLPPASSPFFTPPPLSSPTLPTVQPFMLAPSSLPLLSSPLLPSLPDFKLLTGCLGLPVLLSILPFTLLSVSPPLL